MRDENAGLLDAFQEALAQGWEVSHSIYARVWLAEVSTFMMTSQFPSMCAHLSYGSERAVDVQRGLGKLASGVVNYGVGEVGFAVVQDWAFNRERVRA